MRQRQLSWRELPQALRRAVGRRRRPRPLRPGGVCRRGRPAQGSGDPGGRPPGPRRGRHGRRQGAYGLRAAGAVRRRGRGPRRAPGLGAPGARGPARDRSPGMRAPRHPVASSATLRLFPDLDGSMVRALLGRTRYSEAQEREAEALASLLSARLLGPSGPRGRRRRGGDDVMARLEEALGGAAEC